ncbi:MAG: hypothetical protein LBR12_01470 [Opitutaceae bacterium]|jgi:hypothetical protein|nr:hypothetical protein [Opitutaceae bacterium]
MKKIIITSLVVLSALLNGNASTWTNNGGGGDNLSSTATNWSGGSGNPTDVIEIGITGDYDTAPEGILMLANGGNDYTLSQLVVNMGIGGYIMSDAGEALVIGAGGIINNGIGLVMESGVKTTVAQTWNLGSGAFDFKGKLEINSAVTINLSSGGTVNFSASGSNPGWSGSLNFVGTFDIGAVTVTGSALTEQNLSNITFNGHAVERVGSALVEVIPEPAVTDALLGALALLGVFIRRFR